VQKAALVGREEELDRLDAFLADEREELTRLLVEGDPGIGKTALWAAGLERARALGYRVLQASPAAAERTLSFAALGDCSKVSTRTSRPCPDRSGARCGSRSRTKSKTGSRRSGRPSQ
jgi:hypothetical protein